MFAEYLSGEASEWSVRSPAALTDRIRELTQHRAVVQPFGERSLLRDACHRRDPRRRLGLSGRARALGRRRRVRALWCTQLARALARRCIEISRRGGRAVVADPGRPSRRLFQSVLEQEGLRGTSFLPLATTRADGERRLLLLHVEGERSVSDFAAHAELEG